MPSETARLRAERAWARILEILRSSGDRRADTLREGARSDAFAALETSTGLRIPDEFRAVYQVHDGQEGSVTDLVFGLRILPLEDVQREWDTWRSVRDDLGEDGMEDLSEFCESTPVDAVRCSYSEPGWLVFANDRAGSELAVDLDPGPTGAVGQVITCGRDEERKLVVAPDLITFFEWLAEVMAACSEFIDSEEADELLLTELVERLQSMVPPRAAPL